MAATIITIVAGGFGALLLLVASGIALAEAFDAWLVSAPGEDMENETCE